MGGFEAKQAAPDDHGVATGIGREVARDDVLREDPRFHAKVTEVRETLHGRAAASAGREAR